MCTYTYKHRYMYIIIIIIMIMIMIIIIIMIIMIIIIISIICCYYIKGCPCILKDVLVYQRMSLYIEGLPSI